MHFREAGLNDIAQIQVVRHAVKENILSDPALVTDADCADYLTRRGKGWVCEMDGKIVGFSIGDLKDHNVWALFIVPEAEGRGIGKKLMKLLLDWYFSQTEETIWLSTGQHTRAEQFYRQQGWKEAGFHGNERRFIMSYQDWNLHQQNTGSHY